MDDFKLATLQLDTIAGEVAHNVHKAMNWAKEAFEQGARFVFFHEGLTADYTSNPMKYGRQLDSSEVNGFHVLAKKYEGYVALGLNEVWQGRPYISMVWLGPEGIVGVYRKSYLWPNEQQMDLEEFNKFLHDYVPHEQGYRLERSVIGAGGGTKVIEVGGLRIGCLICADGGHFASWETFEKDPPDLIFWQNNRGNVTGQDRQPQEKARALKTPMVLTNRVGFSHCYFQLGGSAILADDGTLIAQANEEGREEMIWADYSQLRR
ncbi:MAG: carbon-nitrogen hydrolase family protein [Armatimonadetes bacterium]|nr:carbon-nitrogen hydrolase family protein [Armatimonadota bacterium]